MRLWEIKEYPCRLERKDGAVLVIRDVDDYVVEEATSVGDVRQLLLLVNAVLPFPITTLHPVYKHLISSVRDAKSDAKDAHRTSLALMIRKGRSVCGAVVCMWNDVQITHPVKNSTKEPDKKRTRQEEQDCVAEDKNEVVVELAALAVSAPLRGFGVFGESLIRRAGERLKEVMEGRASQCVVQVHVQEDNSNALRFYKKCGFKEKRRDEKYYSGGDKNKGSVNAVVMTLALNDL